MTVLALELLLAPGVQPRVFSMRRPETSSRQRRVIPAVRRAVEKATAALTVATSIYLYNHQTSGDICN
jgi:hypothetical protein